MAKQRISNKEIADILREIGLILEAQGVAFKPQAYENAAQTVAETDHDLVSMYRECGTACIDDLPGIGESIAKKIEELVTTGTLAYYNTLKNDVSVDMLAFTSIPDVGPKTAIKLYRELGVRTLDELEQAAEDQKIRAIEGFGETTEQNILEGITFVRTDIGRRRIHETRPFAERIVAKMRQVDGVDHCDVAGSVRRWKETNGDIDIVVTSAKPDVAIQAFTTLAEVSEVLEEGETKVVVRYTNDMNGDLRVLRSEAYGSGLLYFTGNKAHNIALREMAGKNGWKLSEYGLFEEETEKRLAGKTEEEIYQKLGLDRMPPELRTMRGEIEAAQNGALPDLVAYDAIRGDLQIQTNWSDGAAPIQEMAQMAQELGLSYIAITDHTQSLAMTNGLDEKRLREQGKEIDGLNEKMDDFRILKSTECDILKDGSLDLADDALETLDLVCVSVHSHFSMSEREMTERIITAMKHPLVNVLLHPTGRIVKTREPYRVNMDRIMEAAKTHNVALEINASERLDIHDTQIREAIAQGVKLVLSTDAHSVAQMEHLRYGIAQARRGWATADDVLNTKPVDAFLAALKSDEP